MSSISRQLKIGNFSINQSSPVFTIAEIGHNHQGSLDLCKKMFDAAAFCGATAVKLQKRSNRDQFVKSYYNASYNSENSFGKTYGEHREFLEFDKVQYKELQQYAESKGLIFFSTAFDFASVDFLQDLDIDCIKIASGDCVNLPLLEYASQTEIPLIVSTGATTMEEIKETHALLRRGKSDFALLQCTSGYPAKYSEINLNVIPEMLRIFPDTIIGLSSHENGISVPIAAVALGARIIEKHFTIDRTLKGTDQAFSLSPSGMSKMCRDIDRTLEALGNGNKIVFDSELKPMEKQRKSLVALSNLKKGHVLTSEDIGLKCPNNGLPPSKFNSLIGKILLEDIAEDEYFVEDNLK